MYKPFSNFSIFIIFIFLASCAPVNNYFDQVKITNHEKKNKIEKKIEKKTTLKIEKPDSSEIKQYLEKNISNKVEIILPRYENKKITRNLINAFELSIYKKEIDNIELNINKYADSEDLITILELKSKPGKIFVGTLNPKVAKVVKGYCKDGILFFSFAADKSLAGDCIFLINFFPEDDLLALFKYFPADSKIALLYPENFYGFTINSIIDSIASKSNSMIVNRASYKEDLTNARDSIKKLSKYDLRKNDLERQKKILKNNNDDASKKLLKKIEKFETLGSVDFTHLILPDFSIRLLEIAPLLPFYDVDPNKVKFVGTGVWDEQIFFNEPSLQGAIFSGIEEKNRKEFFDDYLYIYKEKPLRTSTIPYDLVGIISYVINKNMTLSQVYQFLNNEKIKFDGIDGKFFFSKNILSRELDILQIENGSVKKLNWGV